MPPYSPEFDVLMSPKATPRSQAEMVRLRLMGSISRALRTVTERQLALLPRGRLEFNVQAILRIDTRPAWIRFGFSPDVVPLANKSAEAGWVAAGEQLLRGLDEWVAVEGNLRGVDSKARWVDLTPDEQIIAVHTYRQLIEPMKIFPGLPEVHFHARSLGLAPAAEAPRSWSTRSARRRKSH